MIGLVVVSHSWKLGQAVVELASQMVPEDQRPPLKVAAGLDENTLGTDAAAVAAALEELADCEGILVLVDLGSAVLSAEMALEFIDPDLAGKVKISPAPLVEGLVSAVVTASTGADLGRVEKEARAALGAKAGHLSDDSDASGQPGVDDSGAAADSDALNFQVQITSPHGLHARPAGALVSALNGLDADVQAANVTASGAPVDARSVSSLAGLQLAQGQTMEFWARGADALRAKEIIEELASRSFGDDDLAQKNAAKAPAEQLPQASVQGPVRIIDFSVDVSAYQAGDIETEQSRLDKAFEQVHTYLGDAQTSADVDDIAAIFGAQKELLADPTIARGAKRGVKKGASAVEALQSTMDKLSSTFDQMDDPYLRERGQDVRSLQRLVLGALLDPQRGISAWEKQLETEPGVWILPELDAATAAKLDVNRCQALVTINGGGTGHGAIIARLRGIPAVLGLGDAPFAEGQTVTVNPADRTVSAM